MRRSCATVPSAFPSGVVVDVGPYDDSLGIFNVMLLLNIVNYNCVILPLFPGSWLLN